MELNYWGDKKTIDMCVGQEAVIWSTEDKREQGNKEADCYKSAYGS
jgi:hypothetical protein